MVLVKPLKVALRKEIQQKILKLSKEEKERQTKIVCEKFFALPVFQSSKRISVFLSIENEINTESIVRKILEDEKLCFVPRCNKEGLMQMVKLHSMEDWQELPLTKWGIKQPAWTEKREDAMETGGLDLIIMPGVAFSTDGHRMGFGGGYYDRFLEKIRTTQTIPARTVAMAFREQIVKEVPVSEHDVKIDLVLYAE